MNKRVPFSFPVSIDDSHFCRQLSAMAEQADTGDDGLFNTSPENMRSPALILNLLVLLIS